MNKQLGLWMFGVWLSMVPMVHAQSVILAPTLLKGGPDYALTNYSTDTATVGDRLDWHGLVYWENAQAHATPPILELVIENEKGEQGVVSVVLRPLDPTTLPNWHPSLTQLLPMLHDTVSSWYEFQLTQPAFLQSGYDVVRLGNVLREVFSTRGAHTFRYCPLGQETSKHLRVNSRGKQSLDNAPWASFMAQYDNLKELSNQLDGIALQQETLKSRCQPASFDQVQRWAIELKERNTKTTEADVILFAAVEQLKITTETLPDDTPTYLKRDLHALLLLDVALLEQPTPAERERLLQQKATLLRQLSLYPSLKRVLQEYVRQTGGTAQKERAQAVQRQALERVQQQFNPYQSLYARFQLLENRATYIDKQLSQPVGF